MNLNNQPLVTAVIPSYNHEKYIKESIQSMIDQDYENMEMIIIDDGSSDNSVDIIKTMIPNCKKRFKRFEFRHRENQGVNATLNEAIKWSKGKYLSPLASDDIALSYKISFLVEKIENSNYPAVFGNIKRIGEQNNLNNNIKDITIHTFDKIFTLQNRPFAPSSLYKIKKLKEIGGYPINIAVEDWYMELKLTENGDSLISYPEVLTYYRMHENNTSKNYELLYQNAIKIANLYKNNYLYPKVIKLCNMFLIRSSIKNNSYSQTYYDILNKLEIQTKKFKNSNKEIVIYGNGTIYDLIKKYLSEKTVVFHKDNISQIKNTDFDIILISAIGYEDEITNLLITLYNIDRNKIKTFKLE